MYYERAQQKKGLSKKFKWNVYKMSNEKKIKK